MDWKRNRDALRGCIEDARRAGTQILCLPELCLTGYGCEDAFHAPATAERAWGLLEELLPASRDILFTLGLPVWYEGALYNAVALLAEGRLRGLSAKQSLAKEGVHYEPRWFRAWTPGRSVTLDSPLGPVPFGDLMYELDAPGSGRPIRLGLEICEDAWAADRPGRRLFHQGVDLILNPSASHFAFGKQAVRQRIVLEGSRAFRCAYVYSNLLGNEAGRAIYDGGALIAHNGRLLASGPRCGLDRYRLETAWVDLHDSRVERARRCGGPSPDSSGAAQVSVVKVETAALALPLPPSATLSREVPLPSPPRREQEFTDAVTLGLADYLQKSRSTGFVVSLSGGADSAACVCLVALTHRRLSTELSPLDRRERFGYLASGDLPDALQGFLTTVYQATANSSETTKRAARELAEALGGHHSEWEVEELVAAYRGLAESALGRKLDWKHDDVALQNIQARVRAPGPWLLANTLGALLLSTSNRSEASVGYATMDGDTSGGLAPLAGIDKDFLQRWLVWLESEGPPYAGPIPALASINVQPPTAELRPPTQRQTDEGDLMPYPVLNAIERHSLLHRADPSRVLERLQSEFPQYGRDALLGWTHRFFSLYARNQWKRERYAPSFHLDEWSLDPKTWNRFPILNGGFQAELETLRSAAQPESREPT